MRLASIRYSCCSHQQWLDNIESNISSVAVDVQGGADELRTASEYQRKAGRRAACLMIVLVIVTAVVLLAVGGLDWQRRSKLTSTIRSCHDIIYIYTQYLDLYSRNDLYLDPHVHVFI